MGEGGCGGGLQGWSLEAAGTPGRTQKLLPPCTCIKPCCSCSPLMCPTTGKPAVEKLKLLPRVRDVLSTKRLHSELLDAGVLGGEWGA